MRIKQIWELLAARGWGHWLVHGACAIVPSKGEMEVHLLGDCMDGEDSGRRIYKGKPGAWYPRKERQRATWVLLPESDHLLCWLEMAGRLDLWLPMISMGGLGEFWKRFGIYLDNWIVLFRWFPVLSLFCLTIWMAEYLLTVDRVEKKVHPAKGREEKEARGNSSCLAFEVGREKKWTTKSYDPTTLDLLCCSSPVGGSRKKSLHTHPNA